MIIDSIFQIVDSKIEAIEVNAKRAAVIIINEALFKQVQQEMLFQDMAQTHGKIRSPHSLQVYRGLKVVPSQVVESIEVY